MGEWDNPGYMKDLSKARSLIQGVRVALHICGIKIPEPPIYGELPKELRYKYRNCTPKHKGANTHGFNLT